MTRYGKICSRMPVLACYRQAAGILLHHSEYFVPSNAVAWDFE